MADHDHPGGFHGPRAWAVSGGAGLALGAVLAFLIPAVQGGHGPVIPLWLCAPFALLLGSIALMPFISQRFWHNHFPDFAFFFGGIVTAYYLVAYRAAAEGHAMPYGAEHMLHAGVEYYAFIALVGGLYIVSGAVLIDVRAKGRPLVNTALLLAGAVAANLVGTTGASMLLIRPFMRINRGRLRPLHIVMFIFIVSNCGGCLTPIGDPPLYLGYLKGVPFFWTLFHMWNDWLMVVPLLLAIFFVYDTRVGAGEPEADAPVEERASGVRIRGVVGLVGLALIIAGVFIDPLLKSAVRLEGFPVGATFQIAVAFTVYRLAERHILAANEFTFFPAKEVGLLFLGIFATMVPALGYLAAHGGEFGLRTPTTFYFGTGTLSAVLDNAPTYANFLAVAFGDKDINPQTIATFLSDPVDQLELIAISTGAVFFGAMTYIGNGPNFMVKAIAEGAGVKMPSFFGYLGWAVVILLPVLVIHWLVLIR